MASSELVSPQSPSACAAPAQSPGIAALAWPLAVAAVAYAVLLAVGERLLNDPDTFWHIAAGRWIWAHQAVPVVDPFSHTMAGAPWLAHEWLAELILARCYDAFGWVGIVALTALAASGALALLMATLLRFVAPKLALMAVAMGFFLMAAHLVARPHVLAMPLMVAWVAALIVARADRRAPRLTVLPVMVLWANLHGGFIIGLALACVFAVEAVLAGSEAVSRKIALRQWGLFVAGALVASLATPQGIEGWLFPFRLIGLGSSLAFVGEWHSPDFTRFQPVELWLLGLAVLLAVARPNVPPLRLGLLGLLIYLALTHLRNGELLGLLAPLILAAPLGGSAGRMSSPIPSRAPVIVVAGAAALMVAATALVSARGFAHDNAKIAPVAALATAERARLAGPVLNDYDFGGYLIFAGIPPFVDGRIDLYGDAFMRDYAAALAATGDALPRLLDRYHVTWTLLMPGSPAIAALDRLPGWERVYTDRNAVIHRRR